MYRTFTSISIQEERKRTAVNNIYKKILFVRWRNDIKDKIIIDNGSVKNIEEIPDVVKDIYKISWDLSMKHLIDQAADRGIYVCQSQSLNLWLQNPSFGKLSSMHMYSYSKGLKTGIYYLRRRAVANAQKFTIDPEKEGCLSCSA